LAAATNDNRINLWCLKTSKLLIAMQGHAESIWQLAYSPDDALLASASADGTIRIWDAASGRLSLTLPRHHANWVWTVAWSPDGGRLATGGSDSRIVVWDAVGAVEGAKKADFLAERSSRDTAWAQSAAVERQNAAEKASPLRHWQAHEKSVQKLTWAPTESRMIVSVGAEGSIAIWDGEVGALDCRLMGHLGSVTCVDVNPRNSEVIATGGEDYTVRLWDLHDVEPGSSASRESREQIWGLNLQHYTLKGHEGAVVTLKFLGDGQLLASGSKDCEVRLWVPDLQNPLLLKRFVAHEDWISELCWTVDQSKLFTCSCDGMIYAWKVPRKYRRKDVQLPSGGAKYRS